jgi:hypothetical protein
MLNDLALKYGTDKAPEIKHHYTEFYEELFQNKRGEVKKVVEIGIGTGASLRMWRDYFPNAQIFGADILPEALFEDDRITAIRCDQRNRSDLEWLVSRTGADVDLFIDDGLHRWYHQANTCKTVMPWLNRRVVYVIEDVHSPNDIIKELDGYAYEEIRDTRAIHKDDRLLLVRHK